VNTRIIRALDERWYPQYQNNWDDDLFRQVVLARIDTTSTVLDLGAGAGIVKQMNFLNMAKHVCGVDVDPRVLDNPHLHEAKIGSAEAIPYDDGKFDVVFADNVLEHLQNPSRVFSEIRRVLKPGGWFLVKTPNKWHYMPLTARLTPHVFHRFYNRMRGRPSVDTFPTRYRANTGRKICKLAKASQLTVERVSLTEGRPEYLRISPLTYVVGMAYERIVNASDNLAIFRILLIAELRRPE